MAIFAGIIGMLGRFAGQLLNTTLGWATLLLFGKVPQRKQILLLLMVFGSLVWVALVVGIFVPSVGSLLVAAVPIKDFVGENVVRIGMLIGALVVPLVIGVAAVFLSASGSRPKGGQLVVSVLRGYPFAFALALILVLLAVVATVRKLRSMAKRWEDAHVPVIVKPGRYDEVLENVRAKLDSVGIVLEVRDAGRLVSGPPKLLDLIAGRGLGELVPDRLQLLVGKDVEVLVYPSDLAISGTKKLVARTRAAIATELTTAPAYMTTSQEAQNFEDEMEKLGPDAWRDRPAELVEHLRSLDKRLAELVIPYEEWETLYRMRLQLERDAVTGGAGSALLSPSEGAGGTDEAAEPRRGPSPLDLAIGAAGAALVAVDVAVNLDNRRRDGDKGKKKR